jgi:hypothetical protein
MLETHSLKLSRDDFDYDHTPGFEMGIERNWHVIDPTQVDKNVELYDSDLNKLYNDNRYGIRIFYKLVLPLSYFSDSGVTTNAMLDSDGKFTFDNGLAIGNPTLSMSFGSNIVKNRGLLISEETFKNNNNYMLPDEWSLNHTYTKRSAFANGTSISSLFVHSGSENYLQQQDTHLVSISTPEITAANYPYIFASGYNQGAISSININSGNVAYTVTTEGNSMNVPNSNLPASSCGTKKLMPLLFKPFGMSWCSDDANPDVVGWVYCVLGVKQMMGEATYTVKFIDWDGTVLKQQTVQEGTAATPPSNPVREGYTFTGWLPTTYTDVLEDQDIYAQYIKNVQPTTEPFTFVNGDGDIAIRDIPDVGTGSATVLVTFDKPLSDVTYDYILVREFGAGGGEKTDVVVNNNTVQFTDDDISTHDFYTFQLYNQEQRVGQAAWDAGIIPNHLKFTLSDGSIKELDIRHN